nr:DUF3795 domain protein [Candidatus Lokiarchaeota archaeon]
MSEIIAYCGINCSKCPAYLATQNKDEEILKDLANEWSFKNSRFTSEDLKCDGCLSSERIFSWCKSCEIRKCAIQKNLENCAFCVSFPCDKLAICYQKAPDAKETLENIRKEKNLNLR